jgi:mRNA-degrading endonuclease YafQ of YafQ-DinJ toxin-antitoxin module
MEIVYKPSFIREFKKLPPALQEDAHAKMELFRDVKNHEQLKVHKLTGQLKGFHSFSVTYSHRIVFAYESKDVVAFHMIGSHDVYNR